MPDSTSAFCNLHRNNAIKLPYVFTHTKVSARFSQAQAQMQGVWKVPGIILKPLFHLTFETSIASKRQKKYNQIYGARKGK